MREKVVEATVTTAKKGLNFREVFKKVRYDGLHKKAQNSPGFCFNHMLVLIVVARAGITVLVVTNTT